MQEPRDVTTTQARAVLPFGLLISEQFREEFMREQHICLSFL
jgi:hypothetical protein